MKINTKIIDYINSRKNQFELIPELDSVWEIKEKITYPYADKFYNGKFYTEASCARYNHPEPYSTYKVKQMDEIMLHEIFSF